MASSNFLPDREADLLAWSNTFNGLIATGAVSYGLTTTQATAYAALNTAFANAYTAASGDSTRTPAVIATKKAAKIALIADARLLAGIIQRCPTVTDTQRVALGLNVRAASSPIPAPDEPPTLEIVERLGTLIRIRLHDASGNRSKPVGVRYASIYSHVGPTAPPSISDWNYEGDSNRALADIVFGSEVAPGTVVWLTAQWKNPRGEAGPGCAPISTNIAGGALLNAA